MKISWLLAVAMYLSSSAQGKVVSQNSENGLPSDGHYTNEWVIKTDGGPEHAQRLAIEKGYIFKGEVFGLKDTYLLEKLDHPARHKRDADHITENLINDDRVLWGEQQIIKERTKRGYINLEELEERVNRRKRPDLVFPENMRTEEENDAEEETDDFEVYQRDIEIFEAQRSGEVSDNEVAHDLNERDADVMEYVFELFGHVIGLLTGGYTWRKRSKALYNRFNDELWHEQWYMNQGVVRARKRDTEAGNNPIPTEDLMDMNVVSVYDKGYTGKGVKVSILDDGIEHAHTDLRPNWDKEYSYDVNDNDTDPTPQYNNENAHGTRCAGEVAMAANNKKCGVGIAYNAKIGGIRMLDGPVTDRLEASAIGYKSHLVDVYSASWGPTDDGKTVDGPGRLTREALLNGVTKGRNGKGSIFVWASGNGGSHGDSCSCDGYVNSIYTLTVSSVSESGKFPWYGEKCAATFASTYSSGGMSDGMIVATDLKNKCTDRHSGTSAAAPLAAGIVALMLEARPDLTWRDVQHIVVNTARPWPLRFNKGWQTNAAGLRVNTRFGFGLMDAHAMVTAAKTWVTVPEQKTCESTFDVKNRNLTPGQMIKMVVPMDCPEVQYLETVQLTVNLNATERGTLEVFLRSPWGLKEQLLYRRYEDKSKAGFSNWKLTSVMTWNENPNGNWTVEVVDRCQRCRGGTMGNFTITLHGSTEKPHYLKPNYLKKLESKIEKIEEEIENDSWEGSGFRNMLRRFKGML